MRDGLLVHRKERMEGVEPAIGRSSARQSARLSSRGTRNHIPSTPKAEQAQEGKAELVLRKDGSSPRRTRRRFLVASCVLAMGVEPSSRYEPLRSTRRHGWNCTPGARFRVRGDMHSQIARHRGTRRDLRRLLGRAVLVRLAEASAVGEAKGLGVVQERVEDRAGVKDCHLIEVAVSRLERADVRFELRVVVRKGGRDFRDVAGALLDHEWGTVRRWDGKEEEGTRAVLV